MAGLNTYLEKTASTSTRTGMVCSVFSVNVSTMSIATHELVCSLVSFLRLPAGLNFAWKVADPPGGTLPSLGSNSKSSFAFWVLAKTL